MEKKGRFAPSPSGRMHLGNLFSALLAWLDARSTGSGLVLRMEDLDPIRTGEPWSAQLAEDLRWLGLDWDEGYGVGGPEGPYCQRERTALYEAAFRDLDARGLLYPCWCSRAARLAASAPHPGEARDGASCPCRRLTEARRRARTAERPPAWKIIVPDETISFTDGRLGPRSQNLARECGDFIVRRADGVYAYQLAVTVDDGRMRVTRVVRGGDLLDSTPRQLWLLGLMGFPAPRYIHVPMLLDPGGRRLSKRERDLDMGELRKRFSPEELVGQMAFWAGLIPRPEAVAPGELAASFHWSRVPDRDIFLDGICLTQPLD